MISDEIASSVQKEYRLERAALLLNSSRTHTGPLLASNQYPGLELPEPEARKVEQYRGKLTDDVVALVGAALKNLAAGRLSFGEGSAGFAVNRRLPTPDRVVIGVNPAGPTDYSVPVLQATDAKGKVLAVVFGYARHNTTFAAQFSKICGDYAGLAQVELEQAHPNATAMFLMLCGGDQNPNPRGWSCRNSIDPAEMLKLAEQHGRTLAKAVDGVLAGRLQPLKAPIRLAYQIVEPGFAPFPRGTLEQWAADSNLLRARYAAYTIRNADEGRTVRQIPYQVQAIRFGNSLTLVALGGGVVIDYALRIKSEYQGENIVVAAYSNDVMSYIPSLLVLKEGGFEAESSMTGYGLPGPFNEKVEEVIFGGIHQAMDRVGRRPFAK